MVCGVWCVVGICHFGKKMLTSINLDPRVPCIFFTRGRRYEHSPVSMSEKIQDSLETRLNVNLVKRGGN